MSHAYTFLIGRTFETALNEIFPWFPQPQIVITDASGRDRYLAATPVAAPVRKIVISIESITASGYPFSASQRTMIPWILGRPNRFALSKKLAFTFAAKYFLFNSSRPALI